MTVQGDVNIRALAELARIEITESEEKALEKEIPAILSFVETIQSVAAEGDEEPVAPAHHNVMRDDSAPHANGAHTDVLLKAMPQREGNYLKVKQVITGGKHAQ